MRNSKSLARRRSRFASSRSSLICGWCVDGTVAANTKPYEYFIVLYFGHGRKSEKAQITQNCTQIKQCGLVPTGQYRGQETNRCNSFAVRLFDSRRTGLSIASTLRPDICLSSFCQISDNCRASRRLTDFAALTKRLKRARRAQEAFSPPAHGRIIFISISPLVLVRPDQSAQLCDCLSQTLSGQACQQLRHAGRGGFLEVETHLAQRSQRIVLMLGTRNRFPLNAGARSLPISL